MSTAAHLPAIAASAFSWRPDKATSATCIGWYEIRSDLVTQAAGLCSNVVNRISGGANPLVQASSIVQPAWEATGWNGTRASIQFDGSSDAMNANGLASSVTGTDQPFSMVMVAQVLTLGSVGNIRSIGGFGNTASDNALHDLRLPASTTNVVSSGRRDDASISKIKDAATAIDLNRNTYALVFNGTKSALRKNGALDANLDGSSASADNDVGAMTLNTFTFGALTRLAVSGCTNVRLGGLLVYAGALSATDVRRAENYLKIGHPL